MSILNSKSVRTFFHSLRPTPQASEPDQQPDHDKPSVAPDEVGTPAEPDEQHSGGPSVEPEEPEPEPTTPLLEHQPIATAVAGAAHGGSPPLACTPGILESHTWAPQVGYLLCSSCGATFGRDPITHVTRSLPEA